MDCESTSIFFWKTICCTIKNASKQIHCFPPKIYLNSRTPDPNNSKHSHLIFTFQQIAIPFDSISRLKLIRCDAPAGNAKHHGVWKHWAASADNSRCRNANTCRWACGQKTPSFAQNSWRKWIYIWLGCRRCTTTTKAWREHRQQ